VLSIVHKKAGRLGTFGRSNRHLNPKAGKEVRLAAMESDARCHVVWINHE